MKFENLIETWNVNDPSMEQMDTNELLQSVRRESARIERAVRWRDRMELASAGLVIAVLIPLAIILPAPVSWGCAAMIASVLWVSGCLLAARKRRLREQNRPTRNLIDDLQRDANLIQQQVKLLSSVALWYLLPLGLGIGALVVSVEIASPGSNPRFLGFYVLITCATFIAVHWLNNRIASKQLRPRERSIRQLINDLG